MRQIMALIVVVALGAGCGLLPSPARQPTPESTARPTPEPTPTPQTATPEASPDPTPSLEPTPDPAAIPGFEPGSLVVTTAGGLRIRGLPGVQRRIDVQSLPVGRLLLVLMGPVLADGLGWYLVADHPTDDEPEFSEGWIAAGFEPDPFLAPAPGEPDVQPIVAGYGHVGDATFGPIAIPDEHHALRWIAVASGSGCRFEALLGREPGDGVTVAVGSVSATPNTGRRHVTFFEDHPELRGDLFLTVRSDCSWAISFLRADPPSE